MESFIKKAIWILDVIAGITLYFIMFSLLKYIIENTENNVDKLDGFEYILYFGTGVLFYRIWILIIKR